MPLSAFRAYFSLPVMTTMNEGVFVCAYGVEQRFPRRLGQSMSARGISWGAFGAGCAARFACLVCCFWVAWARRVCHLPCRVFHVKHCATLPVPPASFLSDVSRETFWKMRTRQTEHRGQTEQAGQTGGRGKQSGRANGAGGRGTECFT